MSRYMLVAFSKPVAGREAEYNNWYNNVHLPEVVSVPGFSSAQRFEVQVPMSGEMPGRYLSLYQMDADSPEAVEAAKKALTTADMQRSDAVDRSGGWFVGVFERSGPSKTTPGAKTGTFRLVGITQPKPGCESEFEEWYERKHIPDVVAVPGMVSGQRYKLHSAIAGVIETNSLALYELAANSVEEARETLKAIAAAKVASSSLSIREKTRAAILEACSARVNAPKHKTLA